MASFERASMYSAVAAILPSMFFRSTTAKPSFSPN